MVLTKKNRFILSSKTKDEDHSPIFGYQDLTVTTLDEAIKNIVVYVPRLEGYAKQAKQSCTKNTELTLDESAAIYLYTMPTTFHSELNYRLRGENRDELVPWFAFLKLFINALVKLPSLAITVWRGVASDIHFNFTADPVQTWWTVNSCSKDLKVIECYLDGMGTVFTIEAIHGKDIAKYSAFPEEQEVVLMPGTRLYRKCDPLEIQDRPYIASFKEW
jgi:hypothetical protein